MQKEMKVKVTEVKEQDSLKRKGKWYVVLRVHVGPPVAALGHTLMTLSDLLTGERITVRAPNRIHYLVERSEV